MRLRLVSQHLLVFISVLVVAKTQITAPANTTETTTSAPANTPEMTTSTPANTTETTTSAPANTTETTTSAPANTPETTTTTPQMTTLAPTLPPLMTTLTSAPLTSPLSTSLTGLPFDPCYNYTVLDESWRSTDNEYANQPFSKFMCDNYVNWSGWYRFFIHGQSVPMAQTCIAAGRCGTAFSLWLNGAHPTVEDGVVSRGICSPIANQCCSYQSTQIRVKACPGSYYVYELVKPSLGCDVAYCADASNFTITPVSTSAAPAIFYPFGLSAAGDTINPAADDGSSSVITLLSPFLFFGRKYQQICVNNNGYLTFNQASQDYVPYSFPGHGRQDIIAGLWSDLDNRRRGVVSYHQYTSGSVLTRATQDINNHFPNLNFIASWVFVATWNKVAYYTLSNTVASFQVILISGGNFSFILMNYGDVAGTENQVQAGYDTVYSTNYFAIPGSNSGSSISNLSTSSNVNVPGRWAFRVDGQPKSNKEFTFDPCYNYTVLDDAWRSTSTQYSSQRLYDAYINWIGWYRLFNQGTSVWMPDSCVPWLSCDSTIPMWLSGGHPSVKDGVVTRRLCGTLASDCCFYQSTQIRVKACPGGYYVYELVNPLAGYSAGYCTEARSRTPTTVLDLAAPAIFYPLASAAGDTINPASDDGSSSVITLWSPFLFFGRTYQQIYVNNNGHLTFSQPSSQFVPYSFPTHGRQDIIAGLWTDLDNSVLGVVSYHQYTNGSVLTRATQDINNHFPNLTFTASWVFVATWNKVTYYRLTNTETSFQVVLISGSSYSFILMNYGDIAATENPVEAGFDTVYSTDYFVIPGSNSGSSISNLSTSSNVNVTGRWAFRVDSGPNTYKSNLVGLKVELISFLELADSGNAEIVLQQVKQQLVNHGLPSDVNLKLRKIQKIKP